MITVHRVGRDLRLRREAISPRTTTSLQLPSDGGFHDVAEVEAAQ